MAAFNIKSGFNIDGSDPITGVVTSVSGADTDIVTDAGIKKFVDSRTLFEEHVVPASEANYIDIDAEEGDYFILAPTKTITISGITNLQVGRSMIIEVTTLENHQVLYDGNVLIEDYEIGTFCISAFSKSSGIKISKGSQVF